MTRAYSYIRFSTPEQLKGDSLRRQMEASNAYANEHDLLLDTSLKLQDLGKSAFHGAHKSQGDLGKFLALVTEGRITKGSVLIVENLDRLSREDVMEALEQFMGIIRAGIRLVTLHDGMEYTTQSIKDNWTQLIISITYMARAHDESLRKSQRLKAAHVQKRIKAANGTQKIGRVSPAWVYLNEGRTEYILIPEVCQAITRIFEMKVDGASNLAIARTLNNDPSIWKPPISKRNKSGAWRDSYVVKLLYGNRELIGEYQPHRMKNGKRVPEGDTIPDYFPVAIDPGLWQQVQDIKARNQAKPGNGGGRTGKATNLFTHVAKCGECGSALHFIDKGKSSKGGQYLKCDAARRQLQDSNGKRKCEEPNIRYSEFEQLFFTRFQELDLGVLIPNEDEVQQQIQMAKQQLGRQRAKLIELADIEANLTDTLSRTKSAAIRDKMEVKILDALDQQKDVTSNIKELDQAVKQLSHKRIQLEAQIDKAGELYSLLAKTPQQEIPALRRRIQGQIRGLVDHISVYSHHKKSPRDRSVDKFRIQFNQGYSRSLIVKWLDVEV